ncbi:hypothetical protein C8A01DRAFT_51380 [Parachaetomium inaequale]|uniref:Ig-like domain-containing protein n=1 Tax=Parachaetomium inaequale TaxID=2588326 RepID=A0AAN6P8U4_9PEZI|nr:hypothetical protein C8A01DRAFT_51380 [Parachaetomium inaequale]
MRSLHPLLGSALAALVMLWPAVNATPAPYRGTVASTAVRETTPTCSDGATIENLWLVEQLNVTHTTDELVQPGSASWTLTNTLTNTTERLNCTLRANYICEMNGTPGDDSFHIWLQINLNLATFTLNQSLPCGSEAAPGSAYAIGTAEVYLVCGAGNISCYGDDDGGGSADGLVTVTRIAP